MKTNLQKMRRISIVLCMIMMLSVTLAACVNTDDVAEILDTGAIKAEISEDESTDTSLPCADGQTKAPDVTEYVYINPDCVAIYGECEENAVITCDSAAGTVTTKANGGYYIIQTDLFYKGEINQIKLTAQVDGKAVSEIRELHVRRNATAEDRLDGNSVSVGKDSRLYFDKMTTSNLYTLSQLSSIANSVNNNYNGYVQERAKGQDVDIIYVLVPNATSVYPEIIPEDVDTKNATALYNQVSKTLKDETKVTVVDMMDVFKKLRDDATVVENGGLYRDTDSGLSDYGAYIVYRELMNEIAKKFPDAAPRGIDEFTKSEVVSVGGNLVSYRDMDPSVVTDKLTVFTPKFFGDVKYTENTGVTLDSIKKYVDSEDKNYNFYTTIEAEDSTETEVINGVAERWFIDTDRSKVNLPTALVYRDYSSLAFTDILAERFECALFSPVGDYNINLGYTVQYKTADQNACDYIIVVLSEDSMSTAFKNAVAN